MRGHPAPYWMALVIATLTRAALADPSALPAPQPIERIGACPARYLPQGRYCLPARDAPFIILKRAQCPPSYLPQGAYCVAGRTARPYRKLAAYPTPWSSCHEPGHPH